MAASHAKLKPTRCSAKGIWARSDLLSPSLPRSHLCGLKNKSKSFSTYSRAARIPQDPIVGAAASAGGLLIPHFSVGSEGLSCLIRVRKREGGRRGEKPREIANARAIHHSTTSTCRAMMVIRLPRSEHNETTLASPSFTGVEPWAERHVHGLEVAIRFITRSERDNW